MQTSPVAKRESSGQLGLFVGEAKGGGKS
jgi:hypothetical protein